MPAPAPHPPTPLVEKIADSIRGAFTEVTALNQVSVGALRKVLAGLVGSHLQGSLPFVAQHAPTNVPLKIGRRFATLSLPLEEMREVGRHFGATLNDVAATVVDAGLHAYLRETGRAFAHPFIAMCPVSLRADGDTAIGTRASAMFVRLGEPGASMPERIRQVMDSVAAAKKELGGMSTEAAMTYAVGLVALAGLGASTHLDRVGHPACNLVISNVAGAKETRYLNGARLLGIYPVSALGASIGLNATLASYHDSMDFGFVANAAAIDDLPQLAHHTLQAYEELKVAAGTQPARPRRASS
jgi:WS/DGAT/MGAT family acyltransferase